MSRRVVWVALVFASCGYDPEAKDSDVCDQTTAAVAHQTMQCTEDHDLANARFNRLTATHRCDKSVIVDVCHGYSEQTMCESSPCEWANDACSGAVTVDGDWAFACAFHIEQLSCDQVRDYGDDFSLWLAVHPACSLLLPIR